MYITKQNTTINFNLKEQVVYTKYIIMDNKEYPFGPQQHNDQGVTAGQPVGAAETTA